MRKEAMRLVVAGRVQGVGFRPYVHRLAESLGLAGWVKNDGRGVVVHLEGEEVRCARFLEILEAGEIPPLAHIETIQREDVMPQHLAGFMVRESEVEETREVIVPADTATCHACRQEAKNPADRRYLYPFVNCTDCGPRFTIIRGLPYDRQRTTMSLFPLCATCHEELATPADRRFHAQTNCCAACGPGYRLLLREGEFQGDDPVEGALGLLAQGMILAVKGVGGYHLVCDATNEEAVARLRQQKKRPRKPFVVMVKDLRAARRLAYVSQEEAALLTGAAAPVVVLQRRGQPLAPSVSTLASLGVMLAYTPLYYRLAEEFTALVVTSGNRPGEPTLINDRQAAWLWEVADAMLLHNREIYQRCDDSVVAVIKKKTIFFRRARGFVPLPLELAWEFPEILGAGGQQKNVYCFLRANKVFPGPHLGDLDGPAALDAWFESVERFRHLFGFCPRAVAVDMHPGYLLTQTAGELLGCEAVRVQHHHAHLASCLAENGVAGPALGIIFDGQGFGPDGTMWGGELLVGGFGGFERLGHLRLLPLVSGEGAVREPWRMGCVYLQDALGEGFTSLPLPLVEKMDKKKWEVLAALAGREKYSPLTSSAGRLFDAVSAVLGLCTVSSYEGEPAVLLEDAADMRAKGAYPFCLNREGEKWVVDTRPLLSSLVGDVMAGVPTGTVSARFHRALAGICAALCQRARDKTGLNTVALSGGVFQNRLLLELSQKKLESLGFTVLVHRLLPPGDGGLSVGQAVVGATALERRK